MADPTNLLQRPQDQSSLLYSDYQTPESLKATREYAKALLDQSMGTVPGTKGGWTVGLRNIVDALVGGNMQYNTNQQQIGSRQADVAGMPTRQAPYGSGSDSAPSAALPEGAATSNAEGDTLARAMTKTKSQESGGNYDNVTTTVNPRTGQRQSALGAYGVMDFNVGPWTQEVLGKSMTPDEFLKDRQAQDAVYKSKMGSYIAKYGPEGAGRAWLGGEGGVTHPERTDALGTSVGRYGNDFARALAFKGEPASASDANAAITTALAAKGGQSGTPGAQPGQPQAPIVDPFAIPRRPHISEGQFRNTPGFHLTPEEQSIRNKAYYEEFQPQTLDYYGGKVIADPLHPERQIFSPGIQWNELKAGDSSYKAPQYVQPPGVTLKPPVLQTIEGPKGKPAGSGPASTGPAPASATPASTEAPPPPLIKSEPIGAAPAAPPPAAPQPVTTPTTPAATPQPAQPGKLPFGLQGNAGAQNQVASNAPMATAGVPVAQGPAETGADAITKAQGALPPTSPLGTPPPAATGPMGAKVGAALATQPPAPAPATQTAEIPAQLQELRDFSIDTKHKSAIVEQDAKKYTDNIDNYGRIGSIATKSLPQLQIAMKMVKDPNFYSGVLADPITWAQKGRAAISQYLGTGENKGVAAPIEIFDKVISGNVVNDLKVLLGGLGQIRLAEIDLINKSVANRYNTPTANLAVLNMMLREHTQAANVGQIVQQYARGWVLNDKDQWTRRGDTTSNADLQSNINNYIQRHPLFTDAEIANINQTLDLGKPAPNPNYKGEKTKQELYKEAGYGHLVGEAEAAPAAQPGGPAAPAAPKSGGVIQYDGQGNVVQ